MTVLLRTIRTAFLLVTAGGLCVFPADAAHPPPASPVARDAEISEHAGQWLEVFAFQSPPREADRLAAAMDRPLGRFEVTPAESGRQIVRVSLPFAPGTLPADAGLRVRCGDVRLTPDLRVLTNHPGTPAFVRRVIVTFPFDFVDTNRHAFSLTVDPTAAPGPEPRRFVGRSFESSVGGTSVTIGPGSVVIKRDGHHVTAQLIAPPVADNGALLGEIVERGEHYLWLRMLVHDAAWPRIVEIRADSLGTVAVQAHVQRLDYGKGRDPVDITWQTAADLGWRLDAPPIAGGKRSHDLAQGKPCILKSADGAFAIDFPVAPHKLRGKIDVAGDGNDGSLVTYHRATAAGKLSHQPAAWRRAEFVIAPAGAAPLNVLLEPAHRLTLPSEPFDGIYGCGIDADLTAWPELADVRNYTRRALLHAVADGDDFGNVTGFTHGRPASTFCVNRLNHCPGIFEEAYRSGDARLRDVAVNWCGNFYDLSLWWGDDDTFGGTRYPWGAGSNPHVRQNDPKFTWRGSRGCDFCTKGYDSFFYAYEETGDPRMLAALRAQLQFATTFLRVDSGQCRNIGDVADFMRLYRFTGDAAYLAQADRLWQELKTKLMPNNLFSQSGQPIDPAPPFINDDATGYAHPFAKPYIIGYALLGLPELLETKPEEPRLAETVEAVATFLAESQKPIGAWSYPHPASAGVACAGGMENAVQLARGAAVLHQRGRPIEQQLDAIERTLRLYIHTYRRSGTFMGSIEAWELSTGRVESDEELKSLYAKPADRDGSRDYTEGRITLGGNFLSENFQYSAEVLDFYLRHRNAERLETVEEPLDTMLRRIDRRFAPLGDKRQ